MIQPVKYKSRSIPQNAIMDLRFVQVLHEWVQVLALCKGHSTYGRQVWAGKLLVDEEEKSYLIQK